MPPGYRRPGRLPSRRSTAAGRAKAKKILDGRRHQHAGQPHRGLDADALRPDTEDEANEFQRQLEDSGLFKVTLKSTEWEQYQTIYKEGAYDLCILGWFPDYPDADDYLSPFLVDGGFFQNGYNNPEANKLVAQEQGTDDQAKREKIFGKLQDIAAKDVPFIPSWVGQNTPSTARACTGSRSTLDPSFIFRFWLVTKNG